MTTPSTHHSVVIVGGGAAGISVAARLRRAGVTGIAIVEPSDRHYYQPLWTLVGGGRAPAATTVRPEAALIPRGVTWIREHAVDIDPDARTVGTSDGRHDGYTSCPLVTAHNRMLLAEFDYDLKPTPSIPLINTMKPRYDMYLLKRHGLPAMYWHGMLRGRI